MQTTINKQLQWLKANAQYLSIKKIEEAVGCPKDTLQKFTGSANRQIPLKWQKPITDFIKNFKTI